MLAIRNIGELLVVPRGPVCGRSMRAVERIESAAVLIDEERIAWFGPEEDLDQPAGYKTMDAGDGCVMPGLIDCHTHTLFAGTRESEFVQRLEGRSYAQIAEAGGGIRVTVDAVRKAGRDQLVELALPRLRRMLQNGVTTVEIKSGYGLTVEDELKMLEAITRLQELQPIELVATYLAAHTTPREFAGRPDAYLDTVLDEPVLARIRDGRLAEFCDVFCERGRPRPCQGGSVRPRVAARSTGTAAPPDHVGSRATVTHRRGRHRRHAAADAAPGRAPPPGRRGSHASHQ